MAVVGSTLGIAGSGGVGMVLLILGTKTSQVTPFEVVLTRCLLTMFKPFRGLSFVRPRLCLNVLVVRL